MKLNSRSFQELHSSYLQKSGSKQMSLDEPPAVPPPKGYLGRKRLSLPAGNVTSSRRVYVWRHQDVGGVGWVDETPAVPPPKGYMGHKRLSLPAGNVTSSGHVYT